MLVGEAREPRADDRHPAGAVHHAVDDVAIEGPQAAAAAVRARRSPSRRRARRRSTCSRASGARRRTARRAARKSPGSRRRTCARGRCPPSAMSTEKPIRPSSSRARPAAASLRRGFRESGPTGIFASAIRGSAGPSRREARLEKLLDRVAAAERGGDADEAGDDRADGERHQRERHRRRRFVRAVPRPVAMSAAVIVVRVGRAVRRLRDRLRARGRARARRPDAARRGPPRRGCPSGSPPSESPARAPPRPTPDRGTRRRTSCRRGGTCRTPSSAPSRRRSPRSPCSRGTRGVPAGKPGIRRCVISRSSAARRTRRWPPRSARTLTEFRPDVGSCNGHHKA